MLNSLIRRGLEEVYRVTLRQCRITHHRIGKDRRVGHSAIASAWYKETPSRGVRHTPRWGFLVPCCQVTGIGRSELNHTMRR